MLTGMGRGLPGMRPAPNWNMLPMKGGGGVVGLKGGGRNIGGPAKGGAVKGPCARGSPGGCGCGVLRPRLPGHSLRGKALGLLFLLDPAANGFLPRLGPLPKRLLDSEGLWLRLSANFLVFLEVSPSSDSSVLSLRCSFLALLARRSSSSSEYST